MVTETYRFLIEGNPDVYSALWSDLLEKTSRIQQHPFRIRILTPDPIYANEPVDIEVTSAPDAPTLIADSINIPLTEDVLVDNRWLGRMWFSSTGWNSLMVQQDSTERSLYVHEPEDWKSLRGSRQLHENVIRQGSSERGTEEEKTIRNEPVSPLIFFIVFLISAGFLWLSPKL
jgi:hypothetical protein